MFTSTLLAESAVTVLTVISPVKFAESAPVVNVVKAFPVMITSRLF